MDPALRLGLEVTSIAISNLAPLIILEIYETKMRLVASPCHSVI